MTASTSSIPLFKTIEEYNFRINIEHPRYPDFDIRSFEKNMESVRLKMPPFRIGFFQIALLESGGGTVNADGEPYRLNHFTLFFTLPNQIIFWDVPKDWRGYYLCVDESFYTVRVDGFPTLFDFPYFQHYFSGIQLQKEEARMILDLMDRMNKEYTNPTPYNKPIIKSLLASILSYCIQFYDRNRETLQHTSKRASLSERFKSLVYHHISSMIIDMNTSSLAISDLAEELAVTPKHLSETIKKDLGDTPTNFVNDLLIKEAKKLLRSTDLQIKEVAYLLGFNDTSYFNRLFKKITSQTPATYRALSH